MMRNRNDSSGSTATIREPLLRGNQPVAALWFPAALFHAENRRQRILAAWQIGAQAYAFEQGDLLCFAQPLTRHCDSLPGWPLIRVDGRLISAQLTAGERATLPEAEVVLVAGARPQTLRMADSQPIEPAHWLEVSDYPLRDTFDCSDTLPEATMVIPEGLPEVRDVLHGIPAPSEEQVRFLKQLAERARRGHRPGVREPKPASDSSATSRTLVAVGLILLLRLVVIPWVEHADHHTIRVTPYSNSAISHAPSAQPDLLSAVLMGFVVLGAGFLIALWLSRNVGRTGNDRRVHGERRAGEETAHEASQRIKRAIAASPDDQQSANQSSSPNPSAPPSQPTTPGPTAWSGRPGAPRASGWSKAASLPAKPQTTRAQPGFEAGGVAPRAQAPAGSTGAEPGKQSGKPAATPSRPARPLFARAAQVVPQRWREWLTRLALSSGAARLLAKRQGDYMRDMFDKFENGDLDEALRYAIPLSGDAESLGQAFGTPGPRDDLTLGRRGGTSASIHIGDEMLARLRQIYRRSFEKLDRAQRIDEATFVLAELLNEKGEALDYLERHQRFRQAAELAVVWDRPAAEIVRRLCLADDWRMALAIARRDGAFADAVVQLEAKWPDAARRLRMEWAENLAAKGDLLSAVDVLWPVESAREQAAKWLALAVRGDTLLGARALVKLAALLPEQLAAHGDVLRALRDDPALHFERGALARAALDHPGQRGEISRLLSLVMPALLADHARGNGLLLTTQMQQLIGMSGDVLLARDLPSGPVPSFAPTPFGSLRECLALPAPEPGRLAILDAVPLHAGRYLLAFGESGAGMVDARGRILHRFAVPCERLVIATGRHLALALTKRGEMWRVTRLDLATRTSHDLGVLPMSHFGEEFDGTAWTVASGREVRVLDTTRGLSEILWRIADLPGEVLSVDTSEHSEMYLIGEPDGEAEIWHYAVPSRRLTARHQVQLGSDKHQIWLDPRAHIALQVEIEPQQGGGIQTTVRYNGRQFDLGFAENEDIDGMRWMAHAGRLFVGLHRRNRGVEWRWLWVNGATRVSLAWPAHASPRARATGSAWLMFDETGRLAHFDTDTCAYHALSVK